MRRLSLAVAVTVAVALVAVPALAASGTFADDDGNVHEGNIEAIAADGVTKGCNPPANTLYCPSNPVSRGEMAAFLVRALKLEASSKNHFTDDEGSVFEANINALAAAEITAGCNPPANTHYCPDSPVSRGEMAAFLRRGFEYPAASEDHFTDDTGSVFESNINAIREAGVTAGCNPPDNDNYCPNKDVKRDEMASFLARALELDPITPTGGGGGGGGTVTSPADGEVQWDCLTDPDTPTTTYCNGDITAAQAGDETWYCEDSYGPRRRTCGGEVDPNGALTEWQCDIATSGGTDLTCRGRIDDSNNALETWTCDRTTSARVECAGDLVLGAGGQETWGCDLTAADWICSGDVDPHRAGDENWACAFRSSTTRWDCGGDSTWILPFVNLGMAVLASGG